MSPTVTRGSVVVVGIDGIGSADDALDWAAAEAAARGGQLRIVHVFHPPLLVERAEPFGLDMGRPTRWRWPPPPADSTTPTP